QPCVLYSVTGSNTQARGKLHGLVWLPPDFTVLVSTEHTSVSMDWDQWSHIGIGQQRLKQAGIAIPAAQEFSADRRN
ncbi:hypothetical protein, partial [Burkholderia cenocepacia]|uniref:hypothetical protein n=1 Tax=Burkholderia cenocepacia TaxID=95486 RepID=UPI001ABA8196